MTEIPNIEELQKITKNSLIERKELELKNIVALINTAARGGMYAVKVPTLDKENKTKLEEKGYEVSFHVNEYDSYFYISWKEPEPKKESNVKIVNFPFGRVLTRE